MVYVVVPVYNMEPYLERCVDSVLNQTLREIRVVLVDDGSRDGSGALCDRYAAACPGRVWTVHQPNGGLSAARNAGLARCFALSQDPARDYVLLLDADDFIRPDFLAYALSVCEKENCDGVQVDWVRGTCSRFPPETRDPGPVRILTGAEALLDPAVKTTFCTKLYRLELYRGESFPLGKMNEDEFLFYRLLWKCRRFGVSRAKMYYYFQRPGSIMDTVARALKDNPRRRDWREAFGERIAFFTALGEKRQVQRCYERICIELMFRYAEQMNLPRDRRAAEEVDGTMVREYRSFYPKMIGLDTIRPLRKLLFTLFYLCPMGAVLAARIHPLRR